MAAVPTSFISPWTYFEDGEVILNELLEVELTEDEEEGDEEDSDEADNIDASGDEGDENGDIQE